MTGIGVVEPVMVVCDVVLCRLALHTLEIALSVIPEVVVGVSDVCGSLCIESAVALSLVSIGACVAVEEIAVMYPDMVVSCGK